MKFKQLDLFSQGKQKITKKLKNIYVWRGEGWRKRIQEMKIECGDHGIKSKIWTKYIYNKYKEYWIMMIPEKTTLLTVPGKPGKNKIK